MPRKKIDQAEMEQTAADLSSKAAAGRKKKTTKEISQESESLNAKRSEEQLQAENTVQPVYNPVALISASSITSNISTPPAQSESTSNAAGKAISKKKKESALQRDERFDINTALLAGAIHSVWGIGNDVFARLGLSTRGQLVEEDDKSSVYVTLRFADGMVAGQPISIQKGSIVKVRGYLTHREYYESLRKFLDDAHALSFYDLVPPADLPSWQALSFQRHNGVMNVLEMMILDAQGNPLERFGFEEKDGHDRTSNNRASVEGLIARMWEYPHGDEVDLFTRLAVYDSHTPIDPKRDGNFGRARRTAHYITVRFPNGKTSTGSKVQLKLKTRIRVSGELRDKAQIVTLREELLKTGRSIVAEMMQRVQNSECMNEITSLQESLHLLANAVVVYSMVGGSR